jgi:hypothetical protein
MTRMTRTRSIIAVVLGAAAWAAISACNQQTIETPLRSFDRPSDVALTCLQYNPVDYDKDLHPHGTYSVRPLADCEPIRANTLAIAVPPDYGLPVNYVPPLGPSNFIPFLVALVPQSARGELALVDTAQGKLIDLDPYTPGFGFLPVGKLPEHIRSSKDGCWAVTANSDSCDLSRIDVSTVVHSSIISLFPNDLNQGTIAADGVRQLPLSVPSATPGAPPKILQARPSWIEMAPENDEGGTPSQHGFENGTNFCSGGQHRAWVALPGCGLVVKVLLENAPDPTSMSTAVPTIERALRVDKSGVTEVTDLSTIECPVECAGAIGSGGTADLGAPATPGDMGAGNLPSSQAWPSALAVDAEPDVSGVVKAGRLVIGDGYGERIDIVPFDVASGKIGTPASVTLDPGDNGLLQPGVRVVRVGPRSAAGKFLYAVARDGTVRVIDLDRNAECETNPDPRAGDFQSTWTLDPMTGFPILPAPRSLGCFPVGDPATPRRSPFATSPGIALPPGEVPTDVAFVHLDAPPGDLTHTVAPPAASPGLLVGDFAWILSSDGKGTVVDIYDACPAPNQQSSLAQSGQYTAACIPGNVKQSLIDTVKQFGHPQPILLDLVSHQIRNGHPRFFNPATESDVTGQPRVPDSANPCAVAVPPTSPGIPDGGVPDAGACGSTSGGLPSLYTELVPPELSPAPQERRAVYFVDPARVRNETWVLTWEGVLAGTDRSTGAPLVVPAHYPDAATGADHARGFLSDPGGGWCGRGALAGDKLIFRGCTVDSECDQAAGFLCVHDPGAFSDVSQGMCLHVDDKTDTVDHWTQLCGKLLRSQRKYRVVSAKQGAPVPAYPVSPDPSKQPPKTTPSPASLTDLLELAEVYEPEYAEETHTCVTDDDCKQTATAAAVTITTQVGAMTRQTSCLPDVDGQKRCLATCANPKSDDDCGADFECYPSAFGDNRCMRAPIGDATAGQTFWQTCMPELQQYEIHAGDAFTVSGTSSGFLSNETTAADGECVVPPETLERVRLFQWRVPLSAPECPANVEANPLTASIDPKVLASNVCRVGAPPATGAMSEVIHFENPIFNIGVVLPLAGSPPRPLVPPDGTSVSMNVTGGGNTLQSLLGVDVQAQQPRYATVAPDGQTVYVVDEGKAAVATGLRGQLLRLFSSSQSVDTTFIVR